MREIKFRAINANDEIIYGLPYTDGINETHYYKEFNNRLCWRDETGAHCNQPYKNGTLMQFTGLKDKNGKDIYEGDIIEFDREEYIIEFEHGSFIANPNDENRCSTGFWNINSYSEIIGNIYENSELLKEENKE